MKVTLQIAGAAILIVLSPALAVAMPGQSVAQFTPWAKSNPALHGLARMTNQDTGSPYYRATFRAGGAAGTFTADVDDREKISDEIVAMDAASESYDILKHLEAATPLLETVYGPAVSADFTGAKKLGRWTLFGELEPTALYRGNLYAYELWWSSVKVIPLGGVDAEVKRIEACVAHECGD